MKKQTVKLYITLFIVSAIISACGTSQKISSKNFYAIYSKKLGIQLKGNEDKKLIETVASWKGTPYKYGGTTKKGTDCSGFVGSVYKEAFGKKLHRSSRNMIKDVRTISKKRLACGNLIFFKTNGRKISHVGIYIADNKFIHAANNGVIVNDLDQSYYKKTYYKSGKVK